MLSKNGFVTLAVVTLALAPFVRAAEPSVELTKKQLKALVANAKTPANHMELAAYYRGEAERLKAKQNEHEEEAAEYYKDPLRHPGPKYPTLGQHCRDLAYYYGKAAERAQRLASVHEQMAAIARESSNGTALNSEQRQGASPSVAGGESKIMDFTEMMANHSGMADVKAVDVQLDQKVAAMNEATGDAKIAAMAAVINELVSQRTATRDRTIAMPCDMMGNRDTPRDPQGGSMSECPMMKDMRGSGAKQ